MAMNRLGFTDTEAGFLSYGEFYDLYREYQRMFDLENMLRVGKTTYAGLKKQSEDREEIIDF